MSLTTLQTIKWNILLGNLFEHYDTALFGLLAPFFAPLFFPNSDPVTSLLMIYCLIPLGMLARPLGSLFFGYIGDQYGRKKALIYSLLGMAITTTAIGVLPTYQSIGFLAPLLLSLGRILQNFFASGESMGGAIYLMENSNQSQHNWLSSLFNASTVAGILLASIGASLIYFFQYLNGWRLLYLFGSITAIFALIFRTQLESDSVKKNSCLPSSDLRNSCWHMRWQILTVASAAGFSYACYTVALLLVNGFVPLFSAFTNTEMLHLNSLFLLIDLLLLPLFGLFTHRYSSEKMMLAAGLFTITTGIPLFQLLNEGSFISLLATRLVFVTIGVWFSAPFYAWSQTLIPKHNRYLILSISYALGTQFFGGPTAAISLWLVQKTGWLTSAAFYWMFLGLLSSLLIWRQTVIQKNSLFQIP